MKAFALFALIVAVAVRLILSSMAETELRGDLALLPSQSSAPEVQAVNIVEGVKRILKGRGCELVPDSLVVDVGPHEPVPLNVVGGGVQVRANTDTQRVDLQVSCTRTGPFFFSRTLDIVVHTRGPGLGEASHFPAEAPR